MPIREVVSNSPGRSDMLPPDPNVIIPEGVKRGASASDAIHAQVYGTPAAPTPVQPAIADPAPPAPAAPQTPAPPAATPSAADPTPTREQIQSDDWASRYNSMKGRYDQQQRVNGQLQEQLSMMGEELQRMTAFLNNRGQTPQAPQPDPVQPLLTAKDKEDYGENLIDFAQRAARAAVAPELSALKQENQDLRRRVATTAQTTATQQLTAAVNNWREINDSPEFKQWLRLRDIYSGRVRGEMLREAYASADSARLIAFFQGYLSEVRATGQQPSGAPSDPNQARVPAMTLESVAAPGGAQPGGTSPTAEKPVYTRAQIQGFYDQVRKGVYVGRDAERQRIETDLFAAQREGRVRG